jgi:6-phosphofructokinase 1
MQVFPVLQVTGLRLAQHQAAAMTISVAFMNVDHLSDWMGHRAVDSPLLSAASNHVNFVSPDETVLDVIYLDLPSFKKHKYHQWIRAGPRETLYFEPSAVVAAIVTCGGLCPGLNNVIRSVTQTLLRNYGAKKVWGVPMGYKGLGQSVAPGSSELPWIDLTLDRVDSIHKRGGTVLGSTRGYGPDESTKLNAIMDRLVAEKVDQLYVIGGDGTHRGADAISREAARRKMAMSVCCVPKTIDNDIAFIDQSFGFDTAVSEAVKVINCALIEAQDSELGVGIVKLMGRGAGFVAVYASLASNDVHICLIPEAPFDFDRSFFSFFFWFPTTATSAPSPRL